MKHSLPLADKTEKRINEGYDESHFGENYWMTPDKAGNRRIDRKATLIVNLVKRLVQLKVIPPEPLIVDIGAGPGNMVNDFIESGFSCEGCEFSESGRRLAKEHFNLDMPFLDLRESIPFEDNLFDFAYCVGVMSMIPKKDLPTSFKEMYRILKPDGILHISLLNSKPVSNEPHLTSLTYEEWRNEIIKAGFDDVTSLWPPQREGIGMNNEFCGLFRKFV